VRRVRRLWRAAAAGGFEWREWPAFSSGCGWSRRRQVARPVLIGRSRRELPLAASAGVSARPAPRRDGLRFVRASLRRFEQGLLDPDKWTIQTSGGATAVVQQQLAAHGKYAAQFHALGMLGGGATSAYAYFITKSAPASLLAHNFGRAYFLITPAPRSKQHRHGLRGGTVGFPKPTYLSIRRAQRGLAAWVHQAFGLAYRGTPSPSSGDNARRQVGLSRVGAQRRSRPDHGLGRRGLRSGRSMSAHVDYPGHVPGSAIFNGSSSGLVGGFAELGFGLYDWHPGVAFDLYYDDIVLDVQRVGCLVPAAKP